jgi:hypothetical protein
MENILYDSRINGAEKDTSVKEKRKSTVIRNMRDKG